MNNKIILFVTSLLLVPLLTSCGGGGGGDSAATPVDPAATQDATGIYTGTVTETGVGTFSVTGIITGNQLHFISTDAGTIYSGTVSVTGSTFTASTTNYAIGGSAFSTSTLSGSVKTASSISGSFTSSDSSTGTFSLSYDPVTTRGSSLAAASSNWTVTQGGETTTVSVDSNGVLTGSDTSGCVYNGSVGIIDATVNIYSISISASSCGAFNGAYSGYSVLTDTSTANDTLVYVVTNSNFILYGALGRI